MRVYPFLVQAVYGLLPIVEGGNQTLLSRDPTPAIDGTLSQPARKQSDASRLCTLRLARSHEAFTHGNEGLLLNPRLLRLADRQGELFRIEPYVDAVFCRW